MTGRTIGLVGAVLVLLSAATGVVQMLKHRPESGLDPAIIETFQLRVRAWWILFSVLVAAFYIGQTATVVLFGLISFWALREFITLTPTRLGDHRTLFLVFFFFTPLQYVLVGTEFYGLFSVVIPVYGFLFIPVAIALAGDHKRFLERTAKIQVGLLICVYCLSYAPALLTLHPTPQANRSPEQRAEYRKRTGTRGFNSQSRRNPQSGRPNQIAVFLRAHGATERCLAIPLGADFQPARDRAGDQSQPHVGRTAGRNGQRDIDRGHAVVGHALPGGQLVDGRRDVGGDLGDGFCRRFDDVGHQARPGRERLRHAGRRPRRPAGSHRLDLLRRPGLLPLHPLVAGPQSHHFADTVNRRMKAEAGNLGFRADFHQLLLFGRDWR